MTQNTPQGFDKCGYMKLKNFFIAKETITRLAKQVKQWGKIFTKHISVMGLRPRAYQKLKRKENGGKKSYFQWTNS